MRRRLLTALLFVASILVALLLLELAARAIVARSDLPTLEEVDFYADHVAGIHHLRDFGKWSTAENPRNFLYNVHPGFEDGAERLLVQGDSWAEGLALDASLERIMGRRGMHDIGVIHAGTTSYSPSPMTLQLRRLRQRHGIQATLVLALIDQSDVGDEGCRYSRASVYDESGNLVWLLAPEIDEVSAYDVRRSLLRYRYLHLEPIKTIALLNDLMLQDRLFPLTRRRGSRCGWADILRFAETGSEAEAHVASFERALAQYLTEVFAAPEVRQLLLVTHPHRRHFVADRYGPPFVGDVGTLVRRVVADHPQRSRIRHLDFREEFKDVYGELPLESIFRRRDRGSHLTAARKEAEFPERIVTALVELLRAEAP